jgi:hypothetical protein
MGVGLRRDVVAQIRELKVSCRGCGHVVVQSRDVRVTRTAAGLGLFVFNCPTCHREVWQASDANTLLLLTSAGAQSLEGVAPLELLENHKGSPISWDELLEAHEGMLHHCCPQDELTA